MQYISPSLTQKRIVSRFVLCAFHFTVLHALIDSALFAVPYEEPLMLGLDVAETGAGVKVVAVHSDRPIGDKLQSRDVLRSFHPINFPKQIVSIRDGSDIDDLKSLLESGADAELTFWRPVGVREPPASYIELTVTLDPSDLLPLTEVQEKAYTAAAPEYSGAGKFGTGIDNSVASVRVLYATDRLLRGGQYTGERDRARKPVKYGYCTVTLPPDHRIGELEEPKWWKLEFRDNPHKHVVLASVIQSGRRAFLDTITRGFSDSRSDRKRMLVFVHGYNVTFEDAARRAAQLHHDLNFQGQTAFYSWPSNGTTKSYVSDAGDINWSAPQIRNFLALLCSREDIDEVVVLAHSMGNRGVTEALLQLAGSKGSEKIREIILAAPDIDADVFERDIAPRLDQSYARTTLYASANDRALWASEALSEVFRAGEIRGGEPTVRSRNHIDIIDASAVESGFMGHSYYGDDKSVIADIFHLVRNGLSPGTRFDLIKKEGASGTYWMFR